MSETNAHIVELCNTAIESVYGVDNLIAPHWELATRCHDWRSHVPEIIQDAWHVLSEDARACVCIIAQEHADREEWE